LLLCFDFISLSTFDPREHSLIVFVELSTAFLLKTFDCRNTMPPELDISPSKATTQLSTIEYCSPHSSPARSPTASSPDSPHHDGDEVMVDAKDAGKEVEQVVIGLNDSGMYPLGTVIARQFDEGWFTGKIMSYALIDDDSYPHYHVLYEDGDREDLSLSEIEVLLKAAAEKRNASKEPAKKKRKMTAKAPPKKAVKANSAKKPATVQKRRLTPSREARNAKKPIADLENSDTEVECDSNNDSNGKKKPVAVQKRRLTPPRKVRDTKKSVALLEDSDDSEVEWDSDSNKKAAALPNRRSSPRKAQNKKRYAARLEESGSDAEAETESDGVDMDSDSDDGSLLAIVESDVNLDEKDESDEAPPPKKKQRAPANPKAARVRAPTKKKGAATSSFDKRAAAKPKAARAPSKKKGAAMSTSDKRTAAKPKATPALSTKKDAATSTSDKRNVLKVPYSGGDGLEIISEPQAMFDDMIDTKLTDNGENSEVLIPLIKTLKNRTLRVATMCSGTESPILALDMLQKSIRKHCSTHLSREMDDLGIDVESLFQIEHVFSCEIEPFKQAYIERNFHPPLLFRDIRELGDDKAHTAYGGLVDVPNTPGCVDMLIAGTSCVDYSNLNNRKVSELGDIQQLCPLRVILTRPLLLPNAHRKRLTKRAKVDRHSGGWLTGLKRHSRRLLSSRTSLERHGLERLRSLRNEATQRPSFVSIRRTTTFPIPDSVATYLQ
jgi:hypothetical protein